MESWTDLGATGISSKAGKNYNAIDGALYWDGGKFVMSFGSFWQNLFSVGMTNPPTKTTGSAAANIAFKPEGEHAQEAPFIAKNGNYHYLFFSVGKCCGFDANRPAKGQEYKIQVCRSTSATGGFVDKAGKACTQGVPLFSSPTAGFTDPVARVSTTTPSSALSSTTTTSTPALATVTARRSSVSTRSTFPADGPLYKWLVRCHYEAVFHFLYILFPRYLK
jgi:hypothetical protein